MAIPEDLLRRLQAAFVGADDWYAIERAFTSTVEDDEIDDARPAAYAFGYMLVDARREDTRARHGVFAPRIEWEDGQAFPPPLETVPSDVRDAWLELFDVLDGPGARARLGDLLWVTRHGPSPHVAGREAALSYVALVGDRGWSLMDRVESASRALELTTELNDNHLREDAIAAAVALARSELDNDDEWRPGIPLRVLERLVALPPAARPAELRSLVDQTKQRYGADPFIAESATELQLRLADAPEGSTLRVAQVARWREAARESTGLTRLMHLRHALELARATGQRDEAGEIAVEIEQLSPEELDLKAHSVTIDFPVADVDRFVESFKRHDDPITALARFGIEGPPTGDAQRVDEAVADLASRFPIQRLISRDVLGDRNSLVFSAQTPDDHDRVDRAQYAALGISLFAPIAVRVLATIRESYDRPSAEVLTAFFATPLIDDEVASRLADGVARHWDGDDDAAGLILVTQLEAAVRGIAAEAGIPVTKPPRGESPGGVIGLGALFEKLEGRLEESWRRYLANLLSDPLGINLRNRLAHGLTLRAEATDVAVLVHAACFLRTLAIV